MMKNFVLFHLTGSMLSATARCLCLLSVKPAVTKACATKVFVKKAFAKKAFAVNVFVVKTFVSLCANLSK